MGRFGYSTFYLRGTRQSACLRASTIPKSGVAGNVGSTQITGLPGCKAQPIVFLPAIWRPVAFLTRVGSAALCLTQRCPQIHARPILCIHIRSSIQQCPASVHTPSKGSAMQWRAPTFISIHCTRHYSNQKLCHFSFPSACIALHSQYHSTSETTQHTLTVDKQSAEQCTHSHQYVPCSFHVHSHAALLLDCQTLHYLFNQQPPHQCQSKVKYIST